MVGFALTIVVALRAIRLSKAVVFFCEGTAVLLLAIIGIVVKIKGGYRHRARSASPFGLHGPALAVGGVGEMNVFRAFSGFEAAATLGEESPHAIRIIPKTIAWSLVGSVDAYFDFTSIANIAGASVLVSLGFALIPQARPRLAHWPVLRSVRRVPMAVASTEGWNSVSHPGRPPVAGAGPSRLFSRWTPSSTRCRAVTATTPAKTQAMTSARWWNRQNST